jgi:hypothetical protein
LSNGFIFAEIFNRYYPEDIEMYSFDNCFQLDKKKNNWEYLQKFFLKRNIPIAYPDYDSVIHCAPGSAYEFLKKSFALLTGKDVQDTPVLETFEPEPDYAKTTIAMKMKNSELVRIKDTTTREGNANAIIGDHNNQLREERMNPTRYTKTQQFIKSQKDKLSTTKRKTQDKTLTEISQPPAGEIKQVQVKTANKSIRVMK